jgi:hypothetical protein
VEKSVVCVSSRIQEIRLQTLGSEDDIAQDLVLSSRSITQKYLAAGGDLQGQSGGCTYTVLSRCSLSVSPAVLP